jgi:hypothetical protein
VSTPTPRPWIIPAVIILLAILLIQLAFTAHRNSCTWDEQDHLYAGYMSWKHGDFGLNPEHPPLVKMIAAIPILNMDLKMPAQQDRFFKTEAFLNGKDFLFKNDANSMLFRARMAAAIFTLLLAIFVFLAGREMFGTIAAFIALGLLVFDPTLLGHGAVVTTDAALSCFLFASVYAFYRYVKSPTPWRLVVLGIAVGLTLASKHTGILIFPILFLLAVCEILLSLRAPAKPHESVSSLKLVRRYALAFVAVSAISITILWASYGFRYQARAEGTQLNPPLAGFVQGLQRPHEVRLLQTVARFHLLPESYIYGLADVRVMSDFYRSFVLGNIYPHGVWFYFPVAFVIKSSLALLIFLLIVIWAIATRRFTEWREILFLIVPPVFYLIIAMSSGMNIGVRHILPMYLFFAVLIGGATSKLIQANRKWAYAVAVLLLFQAISVSRTFPAYVAYANELWGGPSNVHTLLSDSNADWAQQLKSVKTYLDERNIEDCWFIYFAEGVIDTKYYGLPCKQLPTADSLWVREPANAPPVIEGTVLISAGDHSGFEFGPGKLNPYEEFKSLKPKDNIDFGVLVYEGRFEIPLAASISHEQRAQILREEKKLPEALAEAQKAVEFAPYAVGPNALAGDILTDLNRADEARPYYQKALTNAKTVEPEYQIGWVEGLQNKLNGNKPAAP